MQRKIKKIKIPVWPVIHLEAILSLAKVYLSQNWSWWGKYEIKFIRKFLKIHPAKYAVTTVSGTMAIESCLLACEIGKGDEVIVPAFTWLTTVTPVVKMGAVPVIVDIDPETLCISPKKIEEAITEKTKAIIPVHLYSAMADMDSILEIAKKYNLKVIEDAAHAHGASYNNKAAGTIGDAGAFSFQQSKLLTSGEGGICITNNRKIAEKIDKFVHIGCSIYSKNNDKDYEIPYSKCLLTEFQAAVLENQCNYLLKETAKREENAKYLESLLQDLTCIRFQKSSLGTTRRSYYNFIIIIDSARFKPGVNINNVVEDIKNEGLFAQNGYGCPVYDYILWNIKDGDYIKKDTQIADKISKREIISLPHTLLLTDKKTIKKAALIIRNAINKHIETV